jgi:DNA-binding response OmpR family regulator
MSSEQSLILLVEDNSNISKLITFKLSKSGYSIEHRDNGAKGWEAVKELKPDLVILDVMLPGMNGFDILQKIRENEETKDTKVMMLTTKSREEDLERGFKMEVEDYLSKPFKPAELLMRIKKILN